MTELAGPTPGQVGVRSGVDIDARLLRWWPTRRSAWRMPIATGNGCRACAYRCRRTVWCWAGATFSARRMPRSGWRARIARLPSAPISMPKKPTGMLIPSMITTMPANWDGNGYRILMGSLGIKSAAGDAQALIAPARTYSNPANAPAGGLNYTFSKYRIEMRLSPRSPRARSGAEQSAGVFDRSIHYTIADYNLENLYDYRDNPFSGCDFTGNSGCPTGGSFPLGGHPAL